MRHDCTNKHEPCAGGCGGKVWGNALFCGPCSDMRMQDQRRQRDVRKRDARRAKKASDKSQSADAL